MCILGAGRSACGALGAFALRGNGFIRGWSFVPFVHTLIRADGSVHICCGRQNAPLGNIKEQTLKEILLGDSYRAERRRMDRHGCKVCGMFFRLNEELAKQLLIPA